jgi:hypothetical protein
VQDTGCSTMILLSCTRGQHYYGHVVGHALLNFSKTITK